MYIQNAVNFKDILPIKVLPIIVLFLLASKLWKLSTTKFSSVLIVASPFHRLEFLPPVANLEINVRKEESELLRNLILNIIKTKIIPSLDKYMLIIVMRMKD